MYKLLISLSILLFAFSCSSSDEEEEQEMMETTCDGSLSINVDGENASYSEPGTAFLVDNELVGGHELGIAWIGNNGNISIQLVMNLGDDNCVPSGVYTLGSLPSNVFILSLQYTSPNKVVSVSNVFEEDGQSGWIEIVSCDDTNDILDVKFGFTGLPAFGGDTPIVVTGGSSENICFSRTK